MQWDQPHAEGNGAGLEVLYLVGWNGEVDSPEMRLFNEVYCGRHGSKNLDKVGI